MATVNKREWTTKDGTLRTRWDATVYVPPLRDPETGEPTGGAPRLLSKTFHRKGDADAWARAQEGLKGSGRSPVVTRQTLAQYLTGWLETSVAGQVRRVTFDSYRASVSRWILKPTNGAPPIGSVPLRRLSVHSFDALYTYMAEYGLRREIKYLHGIVKRALRDAVKRNILPSNPAEYASVPKADASGEVEAAEGVGKTMTREEAGRFLLCARVERLSALWHVLLTGGLRPSEAFALRWADVDFGEGAVDVKRTLTRSVDRKKHPAGWAFARPKTAKSRRHVPLPAVTMRELRAWRGIQNQERLLLGPEWQDHGLLFTTEFGTPLDLSNLRTGSFRRVMEGAGLGTWGPERRKPRSGPTARRPFTPSHRIYDLRHTCASLLLMDGEDLLTVSRRLGHSTITLTADTYAHVAPQRAEAAAARFDKMFGTA